MNLLLKKLQYQTDQARSKCGPNTDDMLAKAKAEAEQLLQMP